MKLIRKIFLIWFSCLAGEALVFLFLTPGPQATVLALIITNIWLLVGIISLFIFTNELNKTNKPAFFNFSLFILYSFAAFSYLFVGSGATLFTSDPYFGLYGYQYTQAFMYLLLSFCIVYVVLDSLFANFKTYQKYAFTLLIVGGVFVYYYYPFFENPRYLYTTEDISDWRAIGTSVEKLAAEGKKDPSVGEIAAITNLGVWRDGKQVGMLFEEQKVARVAELLPYLDGKNYVPLVYRPLYLDNIYMNVLCIVFIFLFFGYQYKNDPPQGAYIEKIIFLFLPYCSLEVLHHFAYIKSVEASTLTDIIQIGQYLSLVNLMMLTVFFGLRLRFITSVKGEFYERELVSDSEHISRWRDAFDNLIVRHFLNPKALHGRLFAPRTPRAETEPAAKNDS